MDTSWGHITEPDILKISIKIEVSIMCRFLPSFRMKILKIPEQFPGTKKKNRENRRENLFIGNVSRCD